MVTKERFMACTKEEVMAQIAIAFGQGTGAIRVSQEAAEVLRRWSFDATDDILQNDWAREAMNVLERIRAIGAVAGRKARERGDTKILWEDVYDSALAMQATSDAGTDLEDRLARILDHLQSYGPEDLDRDIREFARSEVEVKDPLQAHRVESPDAYGIGALFGHSVERG